MTQDQQQTPSEPLSRREFLRLSCFGLVGWAINPLRGLASSDAQHLGRVAEAKVEVYEQPSFNSRYVTTYWRDMVMPITEATIGDNEPAHNRIWYRIADIGYAHSGAIQPVQTRLNNPIETIPVDGTLAEVTVPYTDAHWGPGKNFPFAYRYYYATTHWVTALVQDHHGEPWYRIADDKWDFVFYAPATHLRIVPSEELSPLSPQFPPDLKRLEVHLGEQYLIAYEEDTPVFSARIASGAVFSNGRYLTPLGRHQTFHKRPSRHMAAGDLASNGYDLPGVPWICYITEKGVAFHGTYWHNDFGRPRSHGCINLTPAAAKWIYRWTIPVVPPDKQYVYENYGTRVDVVE